jgi:hypothetical protein
MTKAAKPIAVIQGAASPVIQELIRRFVDGLPNAVRLAGVVEEGVRPVEGACGAGYLRSLSDGALFTIFEDLGPGSEACNLDAAGVVAACGAACRDIAAGCDLVVLNKFGKLEAERGGLAAAFQAAIEAGAPILTSVSPKFTPAWDAFAAPLSVILPPDLDRIEAWWREVSGAAQPPRAASA